MSERATPRLEAQFETPRDPNSWSGQSPPHPMKWLPYPEGGKGWRICKWCGLTLSPDEKPEEAHRQWKKEDWGG